MPDPLLDRRVFAMKLLVPPQRPALTHGDLWRENILADAAGAPAFVDPAVSCTWPEVDLSMWCSPRPPAADAFFAAYSSRR